MFPSPLPPRPLQLARRCLPLLLVLAAAAAEAQTNLRSTFPGRRVGGGTRGECASRVLAHLVPASSVYAPDGVTTIGVLEGPSKAPKPLVVELRPYTGKVTGGGAGTRKVLPASPAGVTLIRVPALTTPTIWESSYQCPDSDAGGDLLAFVSSAVPPARSLLVTDTTPEDRSVQAGLQKLRTACGSQVSRADLARIFSLDDVLTSEWPERLAVRCR